MSSLSFRALGPGLVNAVGTCLAVLMGALPPSVHAGTPAGGARISLPASIQVGQSEVRLGDIASLASASPTILRRLMDLPLGRAPRPGQSFVLERQVLARWIRSHTGLQGEQIVWQGSAFTDISLRNREIPADDIVAVAEFALRSRLDSQLPAGTRIQIQPVAMPRSLVVADEGVELKPRSLEGLELSPRMTTWVDVGTASGVQRSVAVVFEVAVYRPVIVAARDIPAGASLLASDVQTREKNIATVASFQKMQAKDFVDGQRLRRPIRAGEVVTSTHTEPVPDVARGTWATLETSQAGLNLQSRVEILQDGRVGQWVQVKPSNASVSLLARVTGPSRVEIYP